MNKRLLTATLVMAVAGVTATANAKGASMSRNCLTSSARALLGRIEAQFGTMQILSTCRPGARIAGTGHMSRHASGNAVDFNAGSRKAAVVRWLMANHKSGGTMTYAGMSHVHVDIGPRFVSLGAGGRGGYRSTKRRYAATQSRHASSRSGLGMSQRRSGTENQSASRFDPAPVGG
jgi:hypothetical protein